MENAMEYNPQAVHLLDVQYRMDPEIVRFSNIYFYDSQIKNADVVYNRTPLIMHPFQFIDTKRRGIEVRDNLSWRNAYEVVTIRALLNTDPDILMLLQNSKKPRVVVITPYNSQKTLIQSELQKVKKLEAHVATVDSFQGQEAEVVIISTVRTKGVGFIDDPQRLNVALTRAVRVLRIVGDSHFFESLQFQQSTLHKLAKYCHERKVIHDLKIKRIASCPPDWSTSTLWKPLMTQTFHHSLKQLSLANRYIAFNTLIAIATPELKSIFPRPTTKSLPTWNLTRLKQSDAIYVVWIAKKGRVIEAHHAGVFKSCLRFIQLYRNVPVDACIVTGDMSNIILKSTESVGQCLVSNVQSWLVNNDIQNSICDGVLEDLPIGIFELDELQQEISQHKSLPLLIESRSGTGKTNVLFQHMLTNPHKTSCFITVSSRLRAELERRHLEIQNAARKRLPLCRFFTLKEILEKLSKRRVNCSFEHYAFSCKSHVGFKIDITLLHNEIGGVILGKI